MVKKGMGTGHKLFIRPLHLESHKRTLKRDHSFEKSVPVSLLHQLEKRHEEFITSGQYGVRTHINGTQPRKLILNVALAIIKDIPLELVKEWRRNTRHGRGMA